MDSRSKTILSTLDLQVSNIAIVTMYENLETDKMLAFAGSIPNWKPSEHNYILLSLFLQLANTKSHTKIKGKIQNETMYSIYVDSAKRPNSTVMLVII